MLRLKLLGYSRAASLEDAHELLTKHSLPLTELEDFFHEVLGARFLPWPPGEDIVEVRSEYDEKEAALRIEARSGTGRVYRSRCIDLVGGPVCFPDQ